MESASFSLHECQTTHCRIVSAVMDKIPDNAKLYLIAAACRNMGIGFNGKLPWKLKAEMAYFNRITTATSLPGKKNAVVMGRKTWLSIPPSARPLKNRVNVVLSRNFVALEGAEHVAKTLEHAVSILCSLDTLEKIFVIGGENVYREALESSSCFRIYLTRIDADFECDAFFPCFDAVSKFLPVSDASVPAAVQEEEGLQYTFQVYQNALFL